MAFSHLSFEQVSSLYKAALATGLQDQRGVLLQGISSQWVAGLPVLPAPGPQLLGDLQRMNSLERLADGVVPLEVWLRNASLLTADRVENELFAQALDTVASTAAGEPELPPPAELPETKEEIVHEDDTLAVGFLLEGAEAGRAVARLLVPAMSQGQPRLLSGGQPERHLGTGWMVTSDLLITNHHVVNARRRGEPPASDEDLTAQVSETRAWFDYDTEGTQPRETALAALEASNSQLDYAVCRLSNPFRGQVLRLAKTRLDVATGQQKPSVNIIQHPMGEPKRVAMRNNLVSGSQETDLRYFTDTRRGSSGSPVFDDSWTVVALHRASERVRDVQFNGRSTAFVNVGTHVTAILQHLRETKPAVAAEIEAGQSVDWGGEEDG